MKKMMIAMAISCGIAICLAKDVSIVTGADLVAGNAKKESGYSEAQLQSLSKSLKGRELTFENGKIGSVSKDDDDGSVTATISFAAPESGLFHPDFTVRAKFSDPAMAKLVEKLDEGAKVKSLKGRVHYDADFIFFFFELRNATIVADEPKSDGAAIDPEKMTGADLVAGNAKKASGYSRAQLQSLSKALRGRELTFENGKIGSVSKDDDDESVTATISFAAPESGLFHPDFTVRAKFSDPAMAKFVEKLDEGAKVKSLKGQVHYDATFFSYFQLKNATVVSDVPKSDGAAIDPEKMTGADLVAGNAKKESGYSKAQLQALSKALRGRELTFENGKIGSVRKDDDDGSVTAMISFEAPGSGLFHPGFSVRAKFSDPAMAKFVEKLDEGTKVKSLKGRVHYDADFFLFFELKNATIVADAPKSDGAAIDPEKMTGADLVAGNAKKESGYSRAQLQSLSKALKGRELTFENGEIDDVSKDEDDGSVTAMISFEAPGSGLFHPGFSVRAKFSDPAMAKFVEKLDEGTKVKSLKGRVHYDADFFLFFELKDARLIVSGGKEN